ncbi:shikimate kinase [Dethiobacter alkaliphilus]|uniref:Shikimate kinase n=1 Tax=Dethiobacter alkaliphilus AHT 1 TaxID=555088 RepID=C0GE48_DETAL|nr:shikimate kinase [Dethiobacter alkaliphilus]EEG78342.1 Shikimate kinase [Dethiobacter alkaliphilus AHT 1]
MKRISGKNLVLIGFMGTGKTEVGRLLADLLNRRFVDTDRRISEREGMSIPELFAARGEQYFRAAEKEVVAELASQKGLVVSTGGGVVLDGGNVEHLRLSGFVVWLDADVDTLSLRLQGDKTRPLLQSDGLAELYKRREALYREAAHVRVDTAGKAPFVVAREVVALLQGEG